MVTVNVQNHLGHKALLLMTLRRVSVGLVLFVVAVALSTMRSALVSNVKTSFASLQGTAAPVPFDAYVLYGIDIVFIAALLVMILGVVVSWLSYQNYTYTFQDFNLIVKRGIFTRDEVSIPYRQMQDINVSRNLLHIMLGISRVVIDSAGHEEKNEYNETDIIIELLDKDEAESIREFLDEKIGVQTVEEKKEASKI